MNLNIDFEKLLNDAVDAAVAATAETKNREPNFASKADQMELIAKVSASTTISILKGYHQQLCDALQNCEATLQ